MPKARKQREAATPQRAFTIGGGPSMGYTILHNGKPLVYHFEKMWDAIHTRDKLISGELSIETVKASS